MSQPKNYLHDALYISLIVVGIIGLLSFVPGSFFESHHIKPIDLLSDIRKDSLPPTIVQPDSSYLAFIDSCKNGITCFEDYSPGRTGLQHFLKSLGSKEKPVRIAFFGDSFIEGDIFSGDLRQLLQSQFGGKGAGMLPVISPLNNFRKTVIHQFSDNWEAHWLLDSIQGPALGIAGNVFIPTENSWVYYAESKFKEAGDSCQRVSIFYKLSTGNNEISYRINKAVKGALKLKASNKIERADICAANIGDISLSFPANPALYLYGISLEDSTGVILDNYSIRNTPGTNLKRLPASLLAGTDQCCHYDLLILEYGLNVANNKQSDYSHYQKEMVKTIRFLQECFPSADILLLSIADRSTRKNGVYETMIAVPQMVAVQRQICLEAGIVFWNLFEAMGGEKSMVEMVNAKPPKANKDYTHLTFEGGKFLGDLLFQTILQEKERYDKKENYLGQFHE